MTEIRTVDADEEFDRFTDLMHEIWSDWDPRDLTPPHVFEYAARADHLLAADDDGEVVGFLLSFPDSEPATGAVHSVGVHPDRWGTGVGEALLERQRERALERGIERLHWTYDPLVGANANLYVRKLGAVVDTYERAAYGFESIPADRFEVTWHLDSDRVRKTLREDESRDRPYEPTELPRVLAVDGRAVDEAASWVTRTGDFEFAVETDRFAGDPYVAVAIPDDVDDLDPQRHREWRFATRRVFERLLDSSTDGTFRVVDFLPHTHEEFERNRYVLQAVT